MGVIVTGGEESRRFARFNLPVLIEVPALSDVPLVPEDISAGGFGVVVSERPETASIIECTLQVLGGVFKGCHAEIMWVRENDASPSTWTVGLSVRLAGGDQERLDALLRELGAEFTRAT